MKKRILIITLLIFSANIFAHPIDLQTALKVANNYFSTQLNQSQNLTLVYECKSQARNTVGNTEKNVVYYYIFNSDNGFIIVSGDDAVYPILGYSTEGKFESNKQPANIKKWLENYKQQIRYVITHDIQATTEIKNQWNNIVHKRNYARNPNSVSPLVAVTWGQSPYVNAMCPYDPNAGAANGYHAVTGCPATAMAQIMKYWNYPTNGTGFHSYNHQTYGNLSANFGSTTYDWAAMPNVVNGTNDAVATLMYHCGVAVEMHYGPHTSGSYVIMDGYPAEQTSEYAYKTYFGYDASTLRGLRRSNYSDYNWKQLMKNELNASRPVQYAGFGAGGHTFVCDGYDNNDYFHMNWGWGGYADGFFLLDALNPGSGGTGSGAGTYNNGQQAVIGIKPLTGGGSSNFSLQLYENLSASINPIGYGQEFTIHTNIANSGSGTFSGDYCAAAFDSDNHFIDFVEVKTGQSLQGGYYYSGGLDFTTTGMLSLLPGTYHISIFYKTSSGNWQIISDGSYTNALQLEVQNNNDIALYNNVVVSSGDITQNQSFTVNVDIANYGSSNFNGTFSADLYNMNDGSYVENIGTLTGQQLASGYHDSSISFSSNGISVTPGSYLLAILHQPDGGNWQLTGSQNYSNPIKVIVKRPGLQPDNYEPNDSQSSAHSLAISFSGNHANVNTTGSNNHVGTDVDYYSISLPSGYNYTINARTHDSYNSGNGNTYTNDVSWAYLYNNTWSDGYDDIMPGTININNGGTIIFRASPYFTGGTGSYLLDISIDRTPASGINENTSQFKIYPNPADDFVFIKSTTNSKIEQIKILDITGKLIKTIPTNNPTSNIKISVKGLKTGTYICVISGSDFIEQQKLIISK